MTVEERKQKKRGEVEKLVSEGNEGKDEEIKEGRSVQNNSKRQIQTL